MTKEELLTESKRADILNKACKCVCGDREDEYGTPESNFETISKFWNTYLARKSKGEYKELITPSDVAVMMVLLKVSRIASGNATEDSFVDIAGYAACGGEINSELKKHQLLWDDLNLVQEKAKTHNDAVRSKGEKIYKGE